MAHAALISLRQTIQSLINSSHVMISPPSRNTLDGLYAEAQLFQELIENVDKRWKNVMDEDGRRKMKDFQRELREASCILEDALETHFLNLIVLSQSDQGDDTGPSPIPFDMMGLKQYIIPFSGMLRKFSRQDDDGDDDDDDDVTSRKEEEDDDNNVTSRSDLAENKSNMAGFEEEEEEDDDVDNNVTSRSDLAGNKSNMPGFEEEAEEDDDDNNVTSRSDLAGNKSNMAEFEEEEDNDNNVMKDTRGKRSNMVGFSDIFGQLRDLLLLTHWQKPSIRMVSLVGMAGIGKTTLAKEIYEDPLISKSFPHRVWVTVGQKYRVLDVIKRILFQLSPETEKVSRDEMDYLFLQTSMNKSFARTGRYLIVLDDVWDRHLSSNFLDPFLDSSNHRILILFTTRQEHVGAMAEDNLLKLRLMDKEESWDLLREKVFCEESSSCPPELEKAGKKIAEICDGLPLTIVTVADLLSKAANMTPEYWKKVADKEISVLTDAYDQISEVLHPSYENLPEFLKALFLYLAVLPPNYEIPVTKLSMLWDAEGFIELNPITALSTLEDFVLFSLVLERRNAYNNELKACVLHSVFWHLCVREARENKLFHVLKKHADSSAQGIKNQRRLCIHNNVLFGIKDAYKSMASISTARSLLCTGPQHQYPVPICFGHLRLLRVIDVLTIRFYEFPVEVLNLVQLRYLALIYDGKLPPAISKLWNLQFLIVRRYLSILKLHEDESYLPMEIWSMKELKHLQVMGSNLPDPRDGACLPNLVTLLDVNARSCTKGVLEGLPKLEKLRVRIELSVEVVEPYSCFDHISHLNELASLKCVVVNPKLGYKVIGPPAASPLFLERLERLSLSGCGYSWEDMRVIASMKNLEVLKLRCYAFRGQIWEIKQEDFRSLQFLLIEDTDLVQWIVGSGSLQWLECLILKNCYKLEDIQGKFSESLESVEIVDCNVLAVNYAKQLQNDNSSLELSIHSSWDDGKLK
ncbi:putative late blight resistance protein homolog r1a-6 [Phtheirospermum japonicum]|uniref:Putative late blight resistance protein homolog r1a-6 n=1 Tax=Phtheirospermum japonicum TaxID=374723 RepID=A0A830B703_9LAMI|nr:putative late blight resistance protein homolog r1a-6 [Phtheirospermum japonicum]